MTAQNPHDCKQNALEKQNLQYRTDCFKSLLLYKRSKSVNFCIDGKTSATNINRDQMTIKNLWPPNDLKNIIGKFSRFSRPFTSKWGAFTSISRFFTGEWFLSDLIFCMVFVCFCDLRRDTWEGDWHRRLVGMNFGLTCHYIPVKPLNFNFCSSTFQTTMVCNQTISYCKDVRLI